MTKFTPTPEQAAAVTAARDTTDNLIISALAGAAKTSTLVLIAEALPKVSMLCLAFNKRIATEMQERLPVNCTAMTLNSLGHRCWSDTISRRLTLDTSKTYTIVTDLIKKFPAPEQKDLYERLSEIMQAVDGGKTAGYIPDKHFNNAKRLMGDDDFYSWLDEEPTEAEWQIIRSATLKSIEQGFEGKIDFNDQILLPTVFPAAFPYYPLVLIDEAQDLSALNHVTLRKLARKRIIAVGDENQAIYGFRGAHEDSMPLLQQTFNMTKLGLSISFRCPQAVVREAQWRAPHMRFADWAAEGKVEHLPEWSHETPPPGSAIVCRNNAPLFTIAIKLLKNGRYPQIIGNDIGKYLLKVMKKFGKTSLPQADVLAEIDKWKEDKLKKARNASKVMDQVECLRIFARAGDDLGSAMAFAEHVFNSQGPIQLMTGHKAKGLEFDTVFFLDQDLIDLFEPQDKNLKYVIQTRAKKELFYVTTSGFFDARQAAEDEARNASFRAGLADSEPDVRPGADVPF